MSTAGAPRSCSPSPQPHILLLERTPAGGADRVLALLESAEITLDAAGVAILLQCRQDLLRCADRGAMGLRGVDAEAEPHCLQFARRHHRRLAALEHVDQGRARDLARDDAQFV